MSDATCVASLFQRVFRQSKAAPTPEFINYMAELHHGDPSCAKDVPSLVHLNERDEITGFIGLHVLPMRWLDRRLRMAMCSTVMVDQNERDPLAAAKLMKAARVGPQDLSFTETASDVSLRMLRAIGGAALPQHSLDWVRIINPLAALVDASAARLPLLRHLAPVAAGAQRLLRRSKVGAHPRWTSLHDNAAPPSGVTVREITSVEFADLFIAMTAQFAIRPDWTAAEVVHLTEKAMVKPTFGTPVLAAVFDRWQKPVGAFLYHSRRHSAARVTQLLAFNGKAGCVLDALIADAAARGASLIRGRSQPFLMDAILARRIMLLNVASSAIHCRDPEISKAFGTGDCFVNGLVGEQWSQLIGGRFD